MNEMTKKEKFKKFVSDHRETITKITVYTTLIAGSIAIIAKTISDSQEEQQKRVDAVNEHNAWTKEENLWIDEQNAADKIVYLLHDWSYLVVPKDAEIELVADRKLDQHPLPVVK